MRLLRADINIFDSKARHIRSRDRFAELNKKVSAPAYDGGAGQNELFTPRRHEHQTRKQFLVQLVCTALAAFPRSGHVRCRSAWPSVSDLLAAMSGFELIPPAAPADPNVADSPGVRGKMTLAV